MRLRPATEADARAAAELVIAGDVDGLGEGDYSLGDLHDEWSERGFARELDAAVVEDGAGAMVAYAHFRGPDDVLATVDPRRRGEGAGSVLLAWIEHRARERGATRIRQGIGHRAAGARALLEDRGYERVRSYWRMQRDCRPDDAEPEGLRPAALTDAPALYAVHEAAFAGTADYRPQDEEDWTQRTFGAHGLDLRLSRVAERDGRPVGFALARRWADAVLYIPLLAVHPDAAGRGLGSALLRGVFAAAAAAGQRQVQLSVASDNAHAARLYERVGMVQRWRIDDYQKALPH